MHFQFFKGQCQKKEEKTEDSVTTITIFVAVVAKLYVTLCDPMGCRMPGSPVCHSLLEFTQTHVH